MFEWLEAMGREMKSTVMTSRLGTETAWHRSRLSHMWNGSCLWHLRLLDTGYSVITVCMILNSSSHCLQNTLLFVEIYLLSLHALIRGHFETKKMAVCLTTITRTRTCTILLSDMFYDSCCERDLLFEFLKFHLKLAMYDRMTTLSSFLGATMY